MNHFHLTQHRMIIVTTTITITVTATATTIAIATATGTVGDLVQLEKKSPKLHDKNA